MIENKSEKAVKVLVVDDQAGMRLTLKTILVRKGFDVSVSESGEEAVEAARVKDFRLIFMDIKMGGMSGVDALVKIKEIIPSATVIMMTAHAMEEEIERAMREGAYTVIYKPFPMEKIFSIVQECLEDRTLVLLVDDRSQDRKILKAILEKGNYKVIDVESGEECVKQVRERKFQIILLDIRMPGMDGIEAMKRVKEIRPDVSVIMVTAYTISEMLQEAIDERSVACIHKPFDADHLLNILEKSLSDK